MQHGCKGIVLEMIALQTPQLKIGGTSTGAGLNAQWQLSETVGKVNQHNTQAEQAVRRGVVTTGCLGPS